MTAPVVASSTGASRNLEFTVTDLGFAFEDGDGEAVRSVEVTIGVWYLNDNAAWVWDTTDVPSGITFNDLTPAATKVRAEPAPSEA